MLNDTNNKMMGLAAAYVTGLINYEVILVRLKGDQSAADKVIAMAAGLNQNDANKILNGDF